jgi:hypothetical protein
VAGKAAPNIATNRRVMITLVQEPPPVPLDLPP